MEKPSLADLRQAIARLGGGAPLVEPPPASVTATGFGAIDALLGGGFPGGRLTELVGRRSSGKTTLAVAAAARTTAAERLVAWIDAAGELYPPAAAAQGVALERLLIVQPGAAQDAGGLGLARAGEIVARSRAFGLIVVDLPVGGGLIERAAQRLRAAAHEAGVPVVVLAERRGALPHALCQVSVASGAAAPGQRRLVVTVHRGGVAPGGQAEALLGAPAGARFRAPAEQAALAAALAPMQPMRPMRVRTGR